MSRIFEDPKLLEAIAENRDNLTYGWVISVHKGQDKAITALTDGVEELRRMLSDARRSTQAWLAFLDDFVSDPDVASRLRSQIWAGARFLETASSATFPRNGE